jgi:hypothetical protein
MSANRLVATGVLMRDDKTPGPVFMLHCHGEDPKGSPVFRASVISTVTGDEIDVCLGLAGDRAWQWLYSRRNST